MTIPTVFFKKVAHAHIAKNCNTVITCAECKSDNHTEALHPGPSPWKAKPYPPTSDNGREGEDSQPSQEAVSSSCTEVCGNGVSARACSKICLVKVYPQGHRESATKVYVIIDKQSNKSHARSDFFEIFNDKSPPSPYTLKTFGRRACGYMIESLDEKTCIPLPLLIECNKLPNNRSEIPMPNAAFYHPHLKGIANEIPPLDPKVEILLLLGRDILRIHKIHKQINGPSNAPFAQKLDLGWVVIGDVCLGTAHRPSSVNAFETYILENGRPSYLPPCCSCLHVKDPTQSYSSLHFPLPQRPATQTAPPPCRDKTSLSVFACTDKDHMLAPSIEDLKFIKIMDNEVFKDDTQRWVAPLPFRSPRRQLANNRDYAMKRGISWNIPTDTFTFQVQIDDKPFTRRGVLSTINSIFDPLGFLSPVTIQGRSLLRELSMDKRDWDEPLPENQRAEWIKWKSSLQCLQIPRCYISLSPSAADTRELCVFADTSTKAIAAVAYLKVTDINGYTEVGFVLGKSNLAPVKETPFPKLELCAAVLAVNMSRV
ncbi:hypothetical protein QQF64_035655 [Cirrhinus molitorella]|uniref:Reverse transcriptase/retrotransposon-derived protein RNase H-like domain-containing protein n=1 Tax=Cirrhinus molitorella TaxID=172907 RepID=A0ABR3NGD7_9TELE